MMSMTKRWIATVPVLLIAGLAYGEISIAYIHMETVFEGFYKTRRAEASLKKQESVYKERADASVEELKALKQKMDSLLEEADSVALSEDGREKKIEGARAVQSQLQERERELKKFLDDKKREMQRDYMNSRNQLVKEILQKVRSYADGRGFDLVLDVSGMTQNFLPVVLKHPNENDITEVILQEINRGHEDELGETVGEEAADREEETAEP